MEVRRVSVAADNRLVRGSPFIHGFIFFGMHCDKQARVKLAKCEAYNNSTMGCQFCGLTGQDVCGATRLLGYDIPVEGSMGKCHKKFMLLGVDDEERQYTSQEHKTRSMAARAHVEG